MKLQLRNGLRIHQRMHIIACTACASAFAFMLFVVFGTAETEESIAGNDAPIAMESTFPAVSSKEISFISTAQNPLTDKISIEFHSASPRPVELKLVSIAGRDLAQKKIFAKEGINTVTWQSNDDYKGICYLYICYDDKASEVIKVVRN